MGVFHLSKMIESVIPAQAGIQTVPLWMPAFAGMTCVGALFSNSFETHPYSIHLLNEAGQSV